MTAPDWTRASDWRNSAACLGEDPELFFPVGHADTTQVQITEAKAICRTCPVAAECAAWALANRERAGIWGGIDEHEREQVWRHRPRQATPDHNTPADWSGVYAERFGATPPPHRQFPAAEED